MKTTILCGIASATFLTAGAPLPAQPAGAEHVVTMANMSYGRMPGGLKVGDTITWINRDTVPHTVTARDKSFDLRLAPRQTAHQKLTKAGSFPFYCIYHTMMRGTLSVGA